MYMDRYDSHSVYFMQRTYKNELLLRVNYILLVKL
jgi:hypothetical protein